MALDTVAWSQNSRPLSWVMASRVASKPLVMRHRASVVAALVLRGRGAARMSRERRSTSVTSAPRCPLPMTVSPSEVAEAFAGVHDGGALGNVHAAGDAAPEVVLWVALAVLPSAGVPQVLVEFAALGLVPPDPLVDGLVGHPGTALEAHAPGDLPGTPARIQTVFDVLPHVFRQRHPAPASGGTRADRCCA